MKETDALAVWQGRYKTARDKYQGELERMDRRERLYRGSRDILRTDGTTADKGAAHVRNLTMEMIETEVDTTIHQPKVTALRPQDEEKARLIEDMIRNELDRLPMETLNDQSERTCPIQGGDGFLPEWDVTLGSHETVGEIRLTEVHPKKIIPQPGIYTVEEMDWYFIDSEKTKDYVQRRYGVEVPNESEESPEIRTAEADGQAEDLVTVHTAFYRNRDGGRGRYVWVNDTTLEDLADAQVRRIHRCRTCGLEGDGVKCRSCGGKRFETETLEFETLTEDIVKSDGTVIPALSPVLDEYGAPVLDEPETMEPMDVTGGLLSQLPGGVMGVGIVSGTPKMEPTKIPYYKPDRYPLIVRKNVSQYGRFLGGSDVDAIEDQQNAMNKICTKINRKVLGGGSFVTKPAELKFEYTDEDLRVLNISKPQQLDQIQVRNTQVDISSDLALRSTVYEEARQTLGITDSLQGRKDPTATSAVAKQFSAQQAAGRLESKKVMKQAMYQDLFRAIFQLMLAYADEPRTVVRQNSRGGTEYAIFNRWDFLEFDAAGKPWWNDRFLFSCDSAAPLSQNREKLWQENRMNLQQGAYGPANDLESVCLFWEIMEREHYPMAGVVLSQLREKIEAQKAQMQQTQEMGAAGVPAGIPAEMGGAV